MDFRHLIVTCLFSKLRLPFDNQKVKENYTIFLLAFLKVMMLDGNVIILIMVEILQFYLHGSQEGKRWTLK